MSHLKVIDLKNCNLKNIDFIRSLKNVTELNLSCNPIGLPGFLNCLTLTNLEKLELYNCEIKMDELSVPKEIEIAPLKYLNLSYNQISSDLPKLTQLETLVYCKMKRIPDIINFPNLKMIDLSEHQMSADWLFDFILDVADCCPFMETLMLSSKIRSN